MIIGKDLNGPPIITAFNAIRVISVFGIGMAYDVKLMKFIRQRKQQKSPGHVQLVPWKSGPPEKNDVTVPLSASIANSIFLVIGKNIIIAHQSHVFLQAFNCCVFLTFQHFALLFGQS